jgi:hypothetical protein
MAAYPTRHVYSKVEKALPSLNHSMELIFKYTNQTWGVVNYGAFTFDVKSVLNEDIGGMLGGMLGGTRC